LPRILRVLEVTPFKQTGLYQPCVKVIGTIAPKRKQTAIICLILYSECKGMKIF